jgi:hypothetical protein
MLFVLLLRVTVIVTDVVIAVAVPLLVSQAVPSGLNSMLAVVTVALFTS